MLINIGLVVTQHWCWACPSFAAGRRAWELVRGLRTSTSSSSSSRSLSPSWDWRLLSLLIVGLKHLKVQNIWVFVPISPLSTQWCFEALVPLCLCLRLCAYAYHRRCKQGNTKIWNADLKPNKVMHFRWEHCILEISVFLSISSSCFFRKCWILLQATAGVRSFSILQSHQKIENFTLNCIHCNIFDQGAWCSWKGKKLLVASRDNNGATGFVAQR